MKTIIEPFRIKSVEPIHMTTRPEREQAIVTTHYNLFDLHSRDTKPPTSLLLADPQFQRADAIEHAPGHVHWPATS